MATMIKYGNLDKLLPSFEFWQGKYWLGKVEDCPEKNHALLLGQKTRRFSLLYLSRNRELLRWNDLQKFLTCLSRISTLVYSSKVIVVQSFRRKKTEDKLCCYCSLPSANQCLLDVYEDTCMVQCWITYGHCAIFFLELVRPK